MLEAGLLTRLDTAFSRDQRAKIYVQDRMREHGARLWQWIDAGAHFYVCGDATRMAKDVDAALREIVGAARRMGEGEAFEYVKRMVPTSATSATSTEFSPALPPAMCAGRCRDVAPASMAGKLRVPSVSAEPRRCSHFT